MSYTARTKDDPGDVGRAADQQASVDNDAYFKQALEGGASGNVIRQVFSLADIVDNTATEIFKITTTNESGSNDAGVYSCTVRGVVASMEAEATVETSAQAAAKSFAAHFARAMEDGGTGVSSAVSEISETASAATSSGVKNVGTVTLTLSETSEYELSVRITIDLTGTSVEKAHAVFIVELAWFGFLTAPVVTQ